MTRVVPRLVSALILTVWMAPSAGALALGLHLALDHHGPHADAEHALEISDLVRTASHGHHHDPQAAPDHEHDVTVDGPALAPRPDTVWMALLPPDGSPQPAPAGLARPCGSLRRGPPLPLFTSHCSLLL